MSVPSRGSTMRRSGQMRAATVGVVLLACASGVSACASSSQSGGGSSGGSSSSSSGGGSSSGAYKVGVVLQLSGPGSIIGDASEQGAKTAVADLNRTNGFGRKIQVSYIDDATDPNTALQACTAAVQNTHVQAIVGAETSAEAEACNSVAQKAGIPYVEGIQSPGIYCPTNMYATAPINNQLIIPLTQYVLQKGYKKVYLIGSNTAAPHTGLPLAASYIKAHGGSVVGTTYVAAGTTDFSGEVAQIAKAKPDIVIDAITDSGIVPYYKELTTDPRTASLAKASYLLNESAARAVGASIKGVYAQASYFDTVKSSASQQFVSEMKQSFGPNADISQFANATYTGLQVLAAAVKSAGTSPKAVLAALPKTTVTGPGGVIKFDSKWSHFSDLTDFIGSATPKGSFTVVHQVTVAPSPNCPS
jgi:urea transport system substrate-binding protein